jgi:hypothetical protein
MSQTQQINIDTYPSQKSTGAVSIVKLNGVPHYALKGFDPISGAPKSLLVPLDEEASKKQLEAMEASVAAMKVFVADIASAPEKLA